MGELATSVPRNIEAEKEEEEEEEDVEMRDGGEEEAEQAFETMKTPFERALDAEGKPKIRGLATLTLYLSRVRIESLKKIYGYVCPFHPPSLRLISFFSLYTNRGFVENKLML